MNPKIIGVTGYRYGPVTKEQSYSLILAIRQLPVGSIVHQGCCIGIDEYVARFATSCSHRVVAHPPEDTRLAFKDWQQYCNESVDPEDYHDRNKSIVKACQELWVVPNSLTETLRSGTWSTFRYAKALKKPIRVFWPNGNVEPD